MVVGITKKNSPWEVELTTSASPWEFKEREVEVKGTIYMVGSQVNYYFWPKNQNWAKLGVGLAYNQYGIKAEGFVLYGFSQADIYLRGKFQPQRKWDLLPFPPGLFLVLEGGYGITFGEVAGKTEKVGDWNANIGFGIQIGGEKK
ncbi:MAG: hypothetical protein ABH808_03660 [Candidatus Kuenenbacteria bacterium]